MPTREVSEKDVLEAFKLKAVVDGKTGEVRKIDSDAVTKRKTAESEYDASLRTAEDIRIKAITEAGLKRDKAVKAQDDRISKANDEVKTAQKVLDDFQDKLESDAGVRITLPGGICAGGTVRV